MSETTDCKVVERRVAMITLPIGLVIGKPDVAEIEDGEDALETSIWAIEDVGQIQVVFQQTGPEQIAKIARIVGIGYSIGPVRRMELAGSYEGLIIWVNPFTLGMSTYTRIMEAYNEFMRFMSADDFGQQASPSIFTPSTEQVVAMAKKFRGNGSI